MSKKLTRLETKLIHAGEPARRARRAGRGFQNL